MSEESRQELQQLLLARCPEFATATIVVKDAAGEIVGYGSIERGRVGAEVTIARPPEGVRLLSR